MSTFYNPLDLLFVWTPPVLFTIIRICQAEITQSKKSLTVMTFWPFDAKQTPLARKTKEIYLKQFAPKLTVTSFLSTWERDLSFGLQKPH